MLNYILAKTTIEMLGKLNSLKRTFSYITNHPLNQNRKWAALVTFLMWQIKTRLNSEPVIVDWIEGSKFVAYKGLSSATSNLYCGLNDFQEMSFLLHCLRNDDLFVDIGANVGMYSILAAKVSGARVISIEPVPKSLNIIKRNLKLNQIKDKVEVIEGCLGNENKPVAVTVDYDTMNNVIRDFELNENFIEVNQYRLDEILDDVPLLLKVDVEGYEGFVLDGGKRVLSQNRPMAIIIELNGLTNYFQYSVKEIWELLRRMNFNPIEYHPKSRLIEESNNKQQDNYIFVKDTEFFRRRCTDADAFIVNGIQI